MMAERAWMLLTDSLLLAVCGFIFVASFSLLRAGPGRMLWRRVCSSASGLVSLPLLCLFLLIGLADSLQFGQLSGGERSASILDVLLQRILTGDVQSSAGPVSVIMLEQSLKGIRSGWLMAGGFVAWLPLTIVTGVAAGLTGGVFGRLVTGVCDVFEAIPAILLLLMLIFVAQPAIVILAERFPDAVSVSEARLFVICIVLGFVRAPALCRQVQARTARFMASDALAAARSVGLSDARLLRRSLLPELVGVASVALATAFPVLMLTEAVLSYLGMGLDPVTRSLGTVLGDALAIAATDPAATDVLVAALLPLGLMLAAASLFAFSVSNAFGPARH